MSVNTDARRYLLLCRHLEKVRARIEVIGDRLLEVISAGETYHGLTHIREVRHYLRREPRAGKRKG